MATTPEERRPFYDSIEEYLDGAKLDYELHFQPGSDVGEFEEYRLTNITPPVIIVPAILPASPEAEEHVRRGALAALQAHAGHYADLHYQVALCGEGWTAESAQALGEDLSREAPAHIRLTVRTLDDLLENGL